MASKTDLVGDMVFMLGSLFLGAAVGIGAFLFAIDKYIAIYPIPVPVEVEKKCTPELPRKPQLHTLYTT